MSDSSLIDSEIASCIDVLRKIYGGLRGQEEFSGLWRVNDSHRLHLIGNHLFFQRSPSDLQSILTSLTFFTRLETRTKERNNEASSKVYKTLIRIERNEREGCVFECDPHLYLNWMFFNCKFIGLSFIDTARKMMNYSWKQRNDLKRSRRL